MCVQSGGATRRFAPYPGEALSVRARPTPRPLPMLAPASDSTPDTHETPGSSQRGSMRLGDARLGSTAATTEATKEARYRALMERYLGPAVVETFADDDVTEVYVNAGDGVLRADTHLRGKVALGVTLDGSQVEQFLNAVAAFRGDTLSAARPTVQAELPAMTFGGARLQGFVAPVVPRACFVIRKPARRVFRLANYVSTGVMTLGQKDAIESAVRDHENILVCGGTGSGKTTLCNAVLLEMSDQFPRERVVVLEDTAELQCRAEDHLSLRTSEAGDVSLSDLVRFTLRCTPDRIVVGEVRDGAALHLLDAWATGHPGGCATVHATDARGALRRLDRLAQRAGVPPQPALVAEAVGIVVVIQGGNEGRRVRELVRVLGHDGTDYELEPV